MNFFVVIIYVIAVNHAATVSSKMPEPTESFRHYSVLDFDEKIWLYWNFNETYITFEIHGKTAGWIGIGISPNGGMIGADMYVGWVKDGRAYITDRHGLSSNTFPPKDPEQNVELLGGRESDGWTIIKFRRQLVGCEDSYDITIGTNTIKMIWALGGTDPHTNDISYNEYHGNGVKNRGVKSLLLLESSGQCNSPRNEVTNTFDILTGDVTIPGQETYYSCRLLRLPDLKTKQHVVKMEPFIQPGHEALVHHIVIFQCAYEEPETISNIGKSHECHTENMPSDFNRCWSVMTGWAIGGGTLCYPDHVGFPIGPNEPKYILMETHYDNPALRTDFVDNSGIRIHYTKQLRQYDAGVLSTGLLVSPLGLVIPPNTESFDAYAECTKECLASGIESGNFSSINVFGSLLHTHLLGHQVTLRHFTNNDVTELPPIAQDLSYDFNYQETKIFPKEVVVKPGESLQVHCNYNSKKRKSYTLGGLGTKDEMCLAYLAYYPRMPLQLCGSIPQPNKVFEFFNITNYNSYKISQQGNLKSEIIPDLNKTLHDVVVSKEWTEEHSNEFSLHVRRSVRYTGCFGDSQLRKKNVLNYFFPPNNIDPYIPPTRHCNQPSSGKPTSRPTTQNDCSLGVHLQQNIFLISVLAITSIVVL